eukprot:883707_1
MCSQQISNINATIPHDKYRRSSVDGSFAYSSARHGLQVHQAAKDIVAFIDDLYNFANNHPDTAIVINKQLKLACFTTSGIECFNGLTATISGDLTKACYEYAFARSRSVMRIYSMMSNYGKLNQQQSTIIKTLFVAEKNDTAKLKQ